MAAVLREARTGRRDDLEELVAAVRRALERLGERLPTSWTVEAVDDLKAGRLTGWYRPDAGAGGEIGFYSRRAERAFGHVHVTPGPNAAARAGLLVDRIAGAPDLEQVPLNLGTSGLAPEEELELSRAWASRPGRVVVWREGLRRDLAELPPGDPPSLAPRLEAVPVRSITEEALADLDLRAFEGSPDAALFAGDAAEYLRMVQGILDGRLGRFVDEASTGWLGPDGHLAGFLLTVELSPRVGLFADLVVTPEDRRRGLGTSMLRWGLRALAALGYTQAQLWVTEGNRPARSLYERLGFRPFARTLILRQEPGGGSPQPHSEP